MWQFWAAAVQGEVDARKGPRWQCVSQLENVGPACWSGCARSGLGDEGTAGGQLRRPEGTWQALHAR